MEEPVLLAELRRRRLRALEARAGPGSQETPEQAEARAERLAAEATAARLQAIGVRPSAAPEPPVAPPAAADAPAARPPPPPPLLETDAYAEPICRICHGGSELGRLFAPCHCRGTARHVHPACLAAWRTISAGRESFYACDVCGFRYNVRRADWAGVLQSEAAVLCATAALLLAALAAVGAACHAAALRVHLHFYRAVLWLPPWYDASASALWRTPGAPAALDALVSGAAVCGALGTAAATYAAWREDARWFTSHVLPSIGMAFASSGTPVLRAFCAGGVFFGGRQLAGTLRTAAKELLTRFGERVLEVPESDAPAEPAAARVRDLAE
jgi:hypothetical protein